MRYGFVFRSATLIAAILSILFPYFHKNIVIFLYVYSFEKTLFQNAKKPYWPLPGINRKESWSFNKLLTNF
jgi:hypothetical protein